MKAFNCGAGENVVQLCLDSSGIGQKSPIQVQHALEAA
jgi:hypothetical protein